MLELILRTGYSRIPVYDGTIDEVVGLAYAKDVLRRLHDGQADKPLADILRPAPFMPESMRAAECLREMRKLKSHMVIVIDEYGGTAGLVTLEDLLEEIVGEIADEYDLEEPNIEPLPDGDYRVNARLGIDEVNELLDVELPATEWDTIGGCCSTWSAGCPGRASRSSSRGCGCGPSGSRAGASAGSASTGCPRRSRPTSPPRRAGSEPAIRRRAGRHRAGRPRPRVRRTRGSGSGRRCSPPRAT